jgi:hypothetical protein
MFMMSIRGWRLLFAAALVTLIAAGCYPPGTSGFRKVLNVRGQIEVNIDRQRGAV